MFTGLIRELGTVRAFTRDGAGARLTITRPHGGGELQSGESIAVNGVCLTALPVDEVAFAADLSPETLRLTTLASLRAGQRVNLERSLAVGDRMGGHYVQGHVDATGTLVSIDRSGEFALYRWSYPEEFAPLVVEKGSIAVDGVSLTIVAPADDSLAAALIPETLSRTNIGSSQIGDPVNLEFDIMAKYVRRMLEHLKPQAAR